MFLSKLKTLLLFPLPIIGENDEIEKKKLIRVIHYAFILFCFPFSFPPHEYVAMLFWKLNVAACC